MRVTVAKKLKAIEEWLTPKNKHKIRSFLGMFTYYRLFISSFTDIVKPLTKSWRGNKPSSGPQR
jgi:hypothetical protein